MSGHEPMTVPAQPLTLAWREAHVREAERALAEAERAGLGHHYGQGMLWCAIAEAHAAIANVRASERPRVTYREGGPVDGARQVVINNPPGHDAITRAVAGDPEIITNSPASLYPHRYGMPDRPRRPGA